MVEIEIMSSANLGFNFPAITAFYRSASLFSCVHSAGRIKASDEVQTPQSTEETNWTCKFGNYVRPFFHYFNGPSEVLESFSLRLYASNGSIIKEKEVKVALAPFASKMFLQMSIFQKIYSKKMHFWVSNVQMVKFLDAW